MEIMSLHNHFVYIRFLILFYTKKSTKTTDKKAYNTVYYN
ncbi:hypothetical protein M115_3864 [Bacteroides fragilis str. 3719 T6]|nr:hypothetical protein M085_3466 [Bacteroides fragilis str. 3986 N(B)19]EYA47042.1 hypothetical protein M115_3864 [Bacteroides fragilis str. 3719 T6]